MGDDSLPATRRDALARAILSFVLVLGVPLAVASLPGLFDDGDTSWHVAVGQWIWREGAIPAADPFSFTAAGKPWVAMEWLADLILAGAYAVAGLTGLAAAVAAALIALHAIVVAHLQRRASPMVLVTVLLAMDVALAPFMLARPHVLVWPLLAAWTALLARRAETGEPPPLWAALIPLAWTNLHGSFPLAAVIAAPLAFDALVKAQWKTLKGWLILAAASFAAVLINANGLAGLLQPFHVANLKTLHLIQEWQPSTPGFTPLFYAFLLLGLGVLLWKGTRVPLGRLALVLAMLGLAFLQVRHQSWFAIVAAILIPPLLGTRAEPAARVARLALLAVPLVIARALIPTQPPEDSANPRSLIAAIPPQLRGEPVFNEYSFGGPLILAGIRPYIDGRSELYGDDFLTDYVAIVGGDGARFDRAVEQYGIRWTVLPPDNGKLIAQLDSSGRWRRIYADKVGVIHVRTR